MKEQYANESVQKLEMNYSTTCDYQFIYNGKYSVETKIIQYFVMHGLGLCIKVDSYASHMFYA